MGIHVFLLKYFDSNFFHPQTGRCSDRRTPTATHREYFWFSSVCFIYYPCIIFVHTTSLSFFFPQEHRCPRNLIFNRPEQNNFAEIRASTFLLRKTEKVGQGKKSTTGTLTRRLGEELMQRTLQTLTKKSHRLLNKEWKLLRHLTSSSKNSFFLLWCVSLAVWYSLFL